MNPFQNISSIATSGLNAQARRLEITSQNIANADTHGYHRKMIQFENVYDRAIEQDRVKISEVFVDESEPEMVFDPDHPFADSDGYVRGSNVNIMTEFADAREANRSYEAGLEVMQQARNMYASLLDLLRR